MNIAMAERLAKREHTCPKCEQPPAKRCKEYDPARAGWVMKAHPHEARMNLVTGWKYNEEESNDGEARSAGHL